MPVDILNPFASIGIDFYGFLLPWIFTFAIVYGLLMKTKICGEAVNKQISISLAFVMAFFVTAVGGQTLASTFISLFGGSAIFLAGILVVVLFMTMVGKTHEDLGKNVGVLVVLVIIGAALFLASTGNIIGLQIDSQISATVFWLIIILAVIYLVTKEKAETTAPAPKTG